MVISHIHLKKKVPSTIINVDKTSLLTTCKKRKKRTIKQAAKQVPRDKATSSLSPEVLHVNTLGQQHWIYTVTVRCGSQFGIKKNTAISLPDIIYSCAVVVTVISKNAPHLEINRIEKKNNNNVLKL